LSKTLRRAARYRFAMQVDRRRFIACLAGSLAVAPGGSRLFLSGPADARQVVQATPARMPVPDGVPLWQQAMAALDRHAAIARRDRLAIADFGAPSGAARFHLVDLEAGRVEALHVTHGSGSDPRHTGFLQAFSNLPGSNATSEGAFLTRDYYTGRHGRSQRLEGLDPSNDQAHARAIVLHAASYAEPAVLAQMGKLGRSQGCLAFSSASLERVFAFLGEGRLILSGKA
jgi:hypothetical protein